MPVPIRFLGPLVALLSLAPAARAECSSVPTPSHEGPVAAPVSYADGITAAQLSMADDRSDRPGAGEEMVASGTP